MVLLVSMKEIILQAKRLNLDIKELRTLVVKWPKNYRYKLTLEEKEKELKKLKIVMK